MKFKYAMKAVAAAAVLASASFSASAGVVATSVLQIQNFTIQYQAGGLVDFADFSGALIQDFSTNTANLTGFTSVSNSATGTGGVMDATQSCLGGICPGQNVFTHTAPPPPAGTQLARADSLLTGAPITGIGQPTGANGSTVAEVLLNFNGKGGGVSDIGLNSLFTFAVTTPVALRLDFMADLYLRTFLSADSQFGSSAQAASALSFNIDNLGNGANVFQWAPNGQANGITGGTENFDGTNLNTSISSLFPGTTNFRDLAGSQHFQADFTLDPGLYTLSINHVTKVDATQVIPEPGSLALLGLGLIGLAATRRRKAA